MPYYYVTIGGHIETGHLCWVFFCIMTCKRTGYKYRFNFSFMLIHTVNEQDITKSCNFSRKSQ